MRAMILGAGRGERLRPWTDVCPKPLLPVAGQPLIAHHLRKLAAAGLDDVVINIAYRKAQIRRVLGDGRRFGVRIAYSEEPEGAYDTGGGIAQALPLLGDAPFLVISSDVFSDVDYRALTTECEKQVEREAHLILVNNPPHHPRGDFGLQNGYVTHQAPRLTYAGIGIYHPRWFAGRREARFPLSSVLRAAIDAGQATGQYHDGRWIDVGRPATLALVRQGS